MENAKIITTKLVQTNYSNGTHRLEVIHEYSGFQYEMCSTKTILLEGEPFGSVERKIVLDTKTIKMED